jgi:drug/metabolite transporter (DMT)-like permease
VIFTGYLFISLSCVLWGLLGPVAELLYRSGFNAGDVVFFRLFGVFLIGFVPLLKDIGYLYSKRLCYPLLLFAFFTIIEWFSFFTSVKLNGIFISVLLLYTAPFFITIFAKYFFKEKLTKWLIVCVLLGFFGIILLFITSYSSKNINPGITMIFGLISGVSYAINSMFGKYFSNYILPLKLTLYRFSAATLIYFPFVSVNIFFRRYTFPNIMEIFYLIFFPGILAYFFFYYGLSRVEISKAAVFTFIEPLVGSVAAIIFFKETLGYKLIGGAFILFGIFGILLNPVLSGRKINLNGKKYNNFN